MIKNINSLVQHIFAALVLVILLIPTDLAAQCMTYPISIEEKEENASTIVLGKLKNQFSYWDDQRHRIYTLNIIEVSAYFKGNKGAKEIGVITTGGIVGMEAMHVFPRFDIFPQNEYIFFLQGDNQTIDHKEIRKKRPQLMQSETYADAQGAITKQFGRYSELHNPSKYNEPDQFDRIVQLTKQNATTPEGKPFSPRIEADIKFFGGLQEKMGKLKLKNPLFKDLINNPSFSLLPINTMSPNPTNGGTLNPANYVTFTGSGFGSQDAVFYANADDGGQTMVASSYTTDVLSWSGSSIEEKVHQNAGTGPVKINNITSSNDLEVNWSHNCLYSTFSGFTQDTRQKYFLVDMNNSGGYTFTYNTSFSNNGPAKAAFERALETWRCATYINWEPNTNTTSISSAANDNVNVITFNSGIAAGTLGRSYSYFSGTATGACNEENTLWWTREMDIEFDSPPSPSFAWNFGPAASVPFASTYDLESVSLHELGHLHGLGHTISFFDDVMHYALQNGADKRTLSADDEAGGDAKMVYSTDEDAYCFIPDNFNGELIALTSSNCSLTGGCATIAVNITGDSEFCEGQSADLDAGTYSTGDSYDWSTNETSQMITVTAAGTYTVTVTDNNGCTGTDSFTITQNNAPQPTIEGLLSYCEGESTNLDAGTFFNSYLWSTGETSFAITVNSPATYTLTVTDANGCIGTDEVTVVENALPLPEITGEDGFCPGETAEIFAGSGFTSYLWSTGETDPTINVNLQGTYTVTVTNANDCTNSDTFVVFANAAPTPEIEGDTFFCNGEDTFIFVEDGFDSYIWSDGTVTFGANVEESGTYTVTVTDNNGCTGTDEIIVVEQPIPDPNITGNLQICTGNTTTLTSTSGFENYIWSTGSTSNQISISEAGTYTVTVTNNNDCTGTEAVTVVLIPELEPTIVGTLEICDEENTLLSLSESYDTYLWSTDELTSNITVNEAGTYAVTITDNNGCTGTDAVTVVVNDLPTVSIEGDLAFCEGGNTELSISGTYQSILWSNDEVDSEISLTEGGTYSVTVTNNNDCTATDEVIVVVNSNPNPNIEGDLEACFGESLTLTLSDTFNEYAWSNGGSLNEITISESGTYTVTVTNTEGCTGTDEATVVVHDLLEVSIEGDLDFCEGGSTQLSVSDTFKSYLWSTGSTASNIIALEGNTYSVTVTDFNDCTATDEVTVVSIAPPVPVITGDLEFCEGSETELSVVDTYTSIVWSNGMESATIVAETGGTYAVTVTNANGCTGTDEVTVTEYENPTPVISGDLEICESENTILSVPAIYKSYLWSTGQSTPSIEVSETGTYSIEVTDENDCTGIAEVSVLVFENPEPVISGSSTFCTGGSSTLDAGEGFEEYLWNTGQTTRMITVSTADTYIVEVTDENGCVGSTSITVSESGELSLQIGGNSAFCTGGSTTLDAGEGFEEYLWNTGETTQMITVNSAGVYSVEVEDVNGCIGSGSIEVTESGELSIEIEGDADFCDGENTTLDAGAGFEEYIWNTGETTQMITVNSADTYTVEVEDANGCIGSGSIEVTSLALPQVSIEGDADFCESESTILDAGAGFESYDWNTGENTQTIEVNETGTYSVTVTNVNDCSNSASFEVNVLPNPQPIIEGDTDFCEGENTQLDAGAGFNSYLWNTGETTRFITVSESGTYEVTVTGDNGCSDSTSIEVNVFSLPMVLIGGSSTFCEGSNTTLSVTSDFVAYLWNTGETSQSIVVDTEGTYSVEVTDENGCVNTESIDVEETSALMPTIVGDLDFCEGQSTVLDAGAGFQTYLWNTGENSQTITVTIGGTYSVIVTDASGCSGSDEVTVTANTPIEPTIEGDIDFCLGESTTLDAGVGFQSYLWNTGETTQMIVITTGGTYSVSTIDANGCSSVAALTIQENIATTPAIEGELQFCVGTSTTLTAEEGYESYQWNTGATTRIIEVTEEGIYTIEAVDENGCTATNEVEVTDMEAVEPDITGVLQFCEGGSTTLTAEDGYAFYLWNTGETTPTITVTESGNYAVGVTDENGCSSGSFVVVEEREELEVALSGSSTLCNGSSTTLEVAGDYESYLWDTGETTKEIVVNEADTYSVTVTDINGCTGTASQTVSQSDSLEPSIVGDLTICNEGNTELDAGGGFDEYLWSTGETTRMIEVTEGGDYSVIVTNVDGCSGTAIVSVELISPFVPEILGDLSFCAGASTQLIAGIGYTDYIWSNGETAPIIEVTEAGTYAVVVSDENGCTGLNQVEVVELSELEVEITGDLQIASNQTTLLDAGSYSASDEYLWSTGSTEQTILVDTPGIYGVTVTDQNGCTSSASVEVDLIDNVEDVAAFQEFSILPNPFSERATLQFSTYISQNIVIDLFSTDGRQLRRLFDGSVNGGKLTSLEIEAENLAAGVYVLQLTLENNVRVHERLVIMR